MKYGLLDLATLVMGGTRKMFTLYMLMMMMSYVIFGKERTRVN
jgi:hypothetical protein